MERQKQEDNQQLALLSQCLIHLQSNMSNLGKNTTHRIEMFSFKTVFTWDVTFSPLRVLQIHAMDDLLRVDRPCARSQGLAATLSPTDA
jgi:hypothetical protein